MKIMKRLMAILIAVCMTGAVIPAGAITADTAVYYTCGGFLAVNRFTGAVENAVNLKGDLVIPESVEGVGVVSIGDRVFYGMEEITSVTVPASVKTIGDGAFGACTSLKTVKLSDGLQTMGKNVFRYCYSLSDITLPSTISAIGSYSFASCLSLTSISIPEGITSIGSYSFAECKNLTSVSMHKGIREIGDYAFSNCTSLKTISLPSGLMAINTAVFNGCTAFSKVVVPSTVKSIGQSAFGSCTSLKELILPEGVERIYDWAFNGCKNLSVLSMPDSINSIGLDSFYGCENITFYVNAGSYSQVFASANKIPFQLGTKDPDDPDNSTTETPFKDIASHWGKSSIEWAYAKGYFKGITDTEFRPNMFVNRAMVVSLLYRMEGQPASGKPSFTDVPKTAYYADAVAWGESTGVVSGMGDGKYSPTRNITREQLATMLYRYAQYKGYVTSQSGDITQYKDYGKVSNFSRAAMTWAVGAGIITGRPGALLDPKGNASRAEAATMLKRFEELN